ncbi:DNA repair protein RadC [Enterobacter hormaechei]|nr:DNA repair protein RadC [Enterobacter hormaechei]
MSTIPSVLDAHRDSKTNPFSLHDDWIIEQAIALLEQRVFRSGPALEGSDAVRDYLRLKLMEEANEVFAVVFLDNRHKVLTYEPMFKGTINATTIYPRVVVQRALTVNAAATILCHNHPSGMVEPSQEDRTITARLKEALAMVDVRVLDHFIIGKGNPYSFAEAGLL